jgi:hypothetical protein
MGSQGTEEPEMLPEGTTQPELDLATHTFVHPVDAVLGSENEAGFQREADRKDEPLG